MASIPSASTAATLGPVTSTSTSSSISRASLAAMARRMSEGYEVEAFKGLGQSPVVLQEAADAALAARPPVQP